METWQPEDQLAGGKHGGNGRAKPPRSYAAAHLIFHLVCLYSEKLSKTKFLSGRTCFRFFQKTWIPSHNPSGAPTLRRGHERASSWWKHKHGASAAGCCEAASHLPLWPTYSTFSRGKKQTGEDGLVFCFFVFFRKSCLRLTPLE